MSKSLKADNDPQGQLLAAMLAAQAKNTDKNTPIYGCVVVQDLFSMPQNLKLQPFLRC